MSPVIVLRSKSKYFSVNDYDFFWVREQDHSRFYRSRDDTEGPALRQAMFP